MTEFILRAATFAAFWRALLSGSGVTYMDVGKGREQERKLYENRYIACYAPVFAPCYRTK
ncbi:protein of unknown function [Methylotuvimicrobium alcaliphilum 20Z]|uniref:Uncharacterized protein n=1 Tax=Methylotuvimicrobium alcaliphilum (strain DSM 19304 / NCIMB 14124 / VKM B-2133 / 20Z) TaxID=1091494 RepID=G4T241_META2|nr:protein of unknown function [Methylotuvimicrobium alcaliphilum 20Z]